MIQLPFNWVIEKRSSSYTDLVVAGIQAAATGGPTPTAAATGSLESCAGLYGRAFQGAEVDTDSQQIKDALDPQTLGMIGRGLIRSGEIILLIRTSRGYLELLPAASHDVSGSADPDTWMYNLTLGGPSATSTYSVPGDSVAHCRWAVEPSRPFAGISPLGVAILAGKLSAATADSLASEAGMPTGAFLPLPVDGQDETIGNMKADIRKAKGNILTVEAGDFDNAGVGRSADYSVKRFGADPPSALVSVMELATREVYSACGVPPAMMATTDGTAAREASRRWYHTALLATAETVSSELSKKLGSPVMLRFPKLEGFASDTVGKARALQAMVNAGVPLERALALSGLLIQDD